MINGLKDNFNDQYMPPDFGLLDEYFYTCRDPKEEGLVYIRHPWESGVDNSPTWDSVLKRIKVDKASLPPYERKDLSKGIPKEQRPTDKEYDKYVFLVDLFRRLNYVKSGTPPPRDYINTHWIIC